MYIAGSHCLSICLLFSLTVRYTREELQRSCTKGQKRPRNMDYQILHEINKNYISLQEQRLKKDKELLVQAMNVFIEKVRERSKVFDKLYGNLYFSGSAYDGLQVGSSSENDFDLNICFKFNLDCIEIEGLEAHPTKQNFAYLKVKNQHKLKAEERELVDQETGFINPRKMFSLLERAGDHVFSKNQNTFTVNGRTVRITRRIGAPYCLNVSSDGVRISIDLVPAIKFNSLRYLPQHYDVHSRIQRVQHLIGDYEDVGFMAICLWKADSEKFEIDFHDLERKILHNKGCVKTVIRLLKLFRNNKGGCYKITWSHFLKTVVMQEVLAHPDQRWRENNIVQLFVDCFRSWYKKMREEFNGDVFFTQMNLISRLRKRSTAFTEQTRSLERILQQFDRQQTIQVFFSQTDFPKAYCKFQLESQSNFEEEISQSQPEQEASRCTVM